MKHDIKLRNNKSITNMASFVQRQQINHHRGGLQKKRWSKVSSDPIRSISTTISFPIHIEISSDKDKNCMLIESQKYENICSQKFLERLDL